MAMAIRLNDAESRSDINMTPLIDVMLVLLIIFIITIPLQTDAVKIDNPSPGANTPPFVEVVDVAIDFDGTLSWDGRRVDRRMLQGYIGGAALQRPQPDVHIRVDRSAKYEIVAQTLADLESRGLAKISFLDDAR